MSQYEDLESVREAFMSGNFDIPDRIEVDRLPYNIRTSNMHPIEEMYHKGYKAMLIYSLSKENKQLALQQGMQDWIIFIWGFKGLDLVRYDVRMTSRARAQARDIKEAQQNVVGDVVEVNFLNFESNPLPGKVDTGATVCSLHADKMEFNQGSGQVTFICKELSSNQITLPVAEQQAVKSSDGGTEYRPVVTLNIKIGDVPLQNVMFNLNDRSEMEYPVLVGQNALEQGGFLVDPRMNESEEDDYDPETCEVDWDLLQEEFKDIEQAGITQDNIIELVQQKLSERVIKALEIDGVLELTPEEDNNE